MGLLNWLLCHVEDRGCRSAFLDGVWFSERRDWLTKVAPSVFISMFLGKITLLLKT